MMGLLAAKPWEYATFHFFYHMNIIVIIIIIILTHKWERRKQIVTSIMLYFNI
jgi:hypothetical protein